MKILLTAGPTREPIDDVRFISNRSSGRMGLALADAAGQAGHDTTLLLGPVLAPADLGPHVRVLRFNTTSELQTLLAEHFPEQDLLIMAAAVADYRVAQAIDGKTERKKHLRIELESTPDLVAGVAATKTAAQRIVAFALEEAHHLESRATAKMKRKGVDAIVANPLITMEHDGIDAIYLTADGDRHQPGPMTKDAFARWLIDRVTR
ncbi:MAG: phosphopantothenoylcysteine decarboxylase [Planctomycetota bacterium]